MKTEDRKLSFGLRYVRFPSSIFHFRFSNFRFHQPMALTFCGSIL